MLQARSFLLPQLPGRVSAGLVVGLVHVLLFLGVTVWAPRITKVVEATPLQVALLSEAHPQPQKFEPPSPKMMPLDPVSLAVPEVEVSIDTPPAPAAITVAQVPPPPPAENQTPAQPKVISEVAYLQPPSPRYPSESRRSREQGLVSLRVLIDEKGHPREVRIERSSGHRRLDEAAREAVSRAVFRPYVEGGVALPAIVIIPIEFALNTRNALARSSR
jgi:protein TonB